MTEKKTLKNSKSKDSKISPTSNKIKIIKSNVNDKKSKKQINNNSKSKNIIQKGGEGMNHTEIRSAVGLPYLTTEKQRQNVNEVYPGMPEFPPPFLNDCVIS
jgi:hypothetical protein